jgi:transcriptional regulator with XRE-family HTH domain
MDATFDTAQPGSLPELTPLGKRIELLRIGRGLSKQLLARRAATSRQQLWRVMTGKSELTDPLRHRLADVLDVDHRALQVVAADDAGDESGAAFALDPLRPGPAPSTFEAYVSATDWIRATLRSMPAGDIGRQLKRDLLDAIEERAHARGVRLPPQFFALRGEVINGDL